MSNSQQPYGQELETKEEDWLKRELLGLILVFFGLLLTLSLGSFDVRDPWLNQVVSTKNTPIYNKAGLFGSYVGGMLFDLFGIAAWFFPALFCLMGVRRILAAPSWQWWRWCSMIFIVFCLAIAGTANELQTTIQELPLTRSGNVPHHGGGLLGYFLYTNFLDFLGFSGLVLFWLFTFLLSLQLFFGFSWFFLLSKWIKQLWHVCRSMAEGGPKTKKTGIQEREQNSETSVPPAMTLSKAGASDAQSITLFTETEEGFEEAEKNQSTPSLLKLVKTKLKKQKNESLGEEESKALFLNEDRNTNSSEIYFDSQEKISQSEELQLTPQIRLNDCNNETEVDQALENIFQNVSTEESSEDSEEFSLFAKNTPSTKENSYLEQEKKQEENSSAKEFFEQITELSESNKKSTGSTVTPLSSAEEKQTKEQSSSLPLSTKATQVKKQLFPLPNISLLEAIPQSTSSVSRADLERKGKNLMTCLNDFGIACELVRITPGPVVTMFELKPAPGVRVARIANLSDDIALSLKSIAVRVQAPIPGTDTVGIEIPNEKREIVCFKELVQSENFLKSSMRLPLALGKDISGNSFIADLATMPHLLVAGATGAGKSVGINSILLSFILKARPEEVKLLLVDPKRVEMAIYADLPHLVHPVVTEMSLAKNALDWAVSEMDRRYTILERMGVRNIIDYNTKLQSFNGALPDELLGLEVLPYLVIVIDELADLMLVGSKEVETSIVRLAQLARAAGIHLILATQRPSVDVVTGLIKANFPCRIAFQVTSKHDSRTILDSVGAEYLLGKGDMLFKPSGGRFLRLHGAFVSDKNVLAICDYWRSRQKPEYKIDFAEWGQANPLEAGALASDFDMLNDPLYIEACNFVRQQGKVSISLIQRRFRIGFNKAAKFVEQMEQDGIVSPADGSKPRQVIG